MVRQMGLLVIIAVGFVGCISPICYWLTRVVPDKTQRAVKWL